ncbi:hypothetical protein [Bizionia sp.]|uniref:hypothetical protein n=1 Tax=Bizionia sp. TaxID=1954480 RepID=UPI003A8CCC21
MKNRFILLLLSVTSLGFSQISEESYAIGASPQLMPKQLSPPQEFLGTNTYINDALSQMSNNPNSPDYVEGSPLGFEGEGNTLLIHTVDDKYYKFDNGNYNSMSDKLVVKLAEGRFYEFNDKDIVFALINNTKAIKLKDENDKMKYFFVLDQNSEYAILKRINGKIIKGSFSKMTKERISYDKYFVYNDFYLFQNDKLNEIKLNNKTFKMLFKDNGNQMKKYVEEHELSIKDEQDFLQMLRYNKTL